MVGDRPAADSSEREHPTSHLRRRNRHTSRTRGKSGLGIILRTLLRAGRRRVRCGLERQRSGLALRVRHLRRRDQRRRHLRGTVVQRSDRDIRHGWRSLSKSALRECVNASAHPSRPPYRGAHPRRQGGRWHITDRSGDDEWHDPNVSCCAMSDVHPVRS